MRVGPHLVTIERSSTGLWIRLPGVDQFCANIDLWHMLPPAPEDTWDTSTRHGNPQVLLYSAVETDSDDPIVRAIFSTTQTQLFTGDDAP